MIHYFRGENEQNGLITSQMPTAGNPDEPYLIVPVHQ